MIIGIDIGGTTISTALLEGDRILAQRDAPSPLHRDPEDIMPTVLSLLDGWTAQARGIGIGCTGLVQDGEVRFLSAGVEKYLPLKSLLEQGSGLPVLVLNDAWAAAWGEFRRGAHGSHDSLVYVTVSTGIGGGVVQNGHLLTAPHGFAAHIGHLTVSRPAGGHVSCYCGRRDCAEAVASGTAIARRAGQLLGREISCREVFEQIGEQPRLLELVRDCAAAVCEMIANIKALTGTEIIVLGGSVGLNESFRTLLQQALDTLPTVYRVTLHKPALGPQAEIIGAALAMEEQLA